MKDQNEKRVLWVLAVVLFVMVYIAWFCPCSRGENLDLLSATEELWFWSDGPLLRAPVLEFVDHDGQICPVEVEATTSATVYRLVLHLEWVDPVGCRRKAMNGWGQFRLLEPMKDYAGNEGWNLRRRIWRVRLSMPAGEIKREA